MAYEIERKFLVRSEAWQNRGEGMPICQGFLNSSPERTVRVRVAGDEAFLTIKGPTRGITRSEFEYSIPKEDALELLETLAERPLIEKTRYIHEAGGLLWEIDIFHRENEGLILAEVELISEDQPFDQPDWLGREVSDDPRYYNANLIRNPYRNW